MTPKVVNNLNPILSMKSYMKPNCILCMYEFLTILKNLRDKDVTLKRKNGDMYEAFCHKMTLHSFLPSTDDPIIWRKVHNTQWI